MVFRYDNGSDISEACMIRTNARLITNLYEGIPETLLLNVIGWMILVLLFSVLRQQAWDYGRLALVSTSGDNKRWTQLFYAPTSELSARLHSLDNNQLIQEQMLSDFVFVCMCVFQVTMERLQIAMEVLNVTQRMEARPPLTAVRATALLLVQAI